MNKAWQIWKEEALKRWRSFYMEAEVVDVDTGTVWLYAHDYRRMIVKEYVFDESQSVPTRRRIVYCGPVIFRTPCAFLVFVNGEIVDVITRVDRASRVIVNHLGRVNGCYDADIDSKVIVRIQWGVYRVVLGTPFVFHGFNCDLINRTSKGRKRRP